MTSIDRIQIVGGGQARPVTLAEPTVTSSGSSLKGLLLEQHNLPPGEFRASFATHLIGLNTGGAYWQDWRAEDRSGRVLIPTGGISLCSGQEVWCHWDRPRTFIALAIRPEVMQRTAYENAVGYEIELKVEANVIDPVIETFVMAIYSELRAGCPGGPLWGESLATDLSAFLMRQYAVRPVRLRQFRGGIPRPRLKRVIEYIDESLAGELSVAELAGVAEMSPWYFGKLFKQSTGWTVHQYVMNRRIQRAMRLLSRNRFSISDVAVAIGVPNQSQFSRLFRQQTGMTPRSYQAEFD
jgi:AraC family transcriptional regulator